MKNINSFIEDNMKDMISDLEGIVKCLKWGIQNYPTDSSIDIRLCIDNSDTRHGYGESNEGFTWVFRTGSSDYDQGHSQWCAASSVSLSTDPSKLLDKLINQLDL